MVSKVHGVKVFTGLSTDEKPSVDAGNGDKYIELDTGVEYRFDGGNTEWLAQPSGGGGGGGVTVVSLSVTSNGTYSAPSGKAYDPVEVDVPNTYSAADEGKVVSSGALVPQTSSAITQNGTVDTTLINSVDVNVSSGGGDSAEDGIIMRTISGAYENSRVTSIGIYAFQNCTHLTTASFPSATSIGGNAFYSCTRLTTAYFPSATSIGSSAFYSCASLTTASFPSATSIGGNAFQKCASLTTAYFPSATSIGSSAFQNCYNLISFYLLGSSVATLSNSNAFTSTPIGGYTTSTGGVYGSIYVPSSLLASYKAATNWVNFSARFVGVSV